MLNRVSDFFYQYTPSPLYQAGSYITSPFRVAASTVADLYWGAKLFSGVIRPVRKGMGELKETWGRLKKTFDQGNSEEIQREAESALSLIGQIVSEMTNGVPESFKDYLQPILDLKKELEESLVSQDFSAESLEALFEKAQRFLEDKLNDPTSLRSRFISLSTRSSSSPSLEVEEHPLKRLIDLITLYEKDNDSTLPKVKKENLIRALRHVDQLSSSELKGIEAFFYSKNQPETLENYLKGIKESVLDFIKRRMPDLYLEASGIELNTFKPLTDEQEKALLERVIKRETCLKLSDLAKNLEKRVDDPRKIMERIDDAIYFFKQDPKNQEIEEGVMGRISESFLQWIDLFYEHAREELPPSSNGKLEEGLKLIRENFKQRPISALCEFKKRIEKSRLLEEKVNLQANTLDQIINRQEETLFQADTLLLEKGHSHDIKQEQDRLVLQVGSFIVFRTFYSKPGEDPSKEEDVYARIMESVDRAEVRDQKETFLSELKKKIDKREDISFVKKPFLKLTMSIFSWGVNLFLETTISRFVEYLSETVSLSKGNPLGSTQLSFIEKTEECFKAHLISLKEWREGKGSRIKKDAMAQSLEAPTLNGGYTHRELIEQTTKCAFDSFFTFDGFFSKSIGDKAREVNSKPALILLGLGESLSKGFEKFIDFLLCPVLKKLLLYFEAPHKAFTSIGDSIYNRSEYASVIDEFLIEQLDELEKSLDEGLGTSKKYQEGRMVAKKTFVSFVSHGLKLVEEDKQLVPDGQFLATTNGSKLTEFLLKGLKELMIEKSFFIEAAAESLMVGYESTLKRENARTLALKFLRMANDAYAQRSPIRGYYSRADQIKFEEKLGRKVEDADLTYLFAIKKILNREVSDEDLKYLYEIEEGVKSCLEGSYKPKIKLESTHFKKLIAIEKKLGHKPDISNLTRLFQIEEKFDRQPSLSGLISLLEVESHLGREINDSDLENLFEITEKRSEPKEEIDLNDLSVCRRDIDYKPILEDLKLLRTQRQKEQTDKNYPSDDDIKSAVKVKYQETEKRLSEKASQVIKKGTEQVVQKVLDSKFACPVSHMIDFLGVEVFQRNGYKSNFFEKMDKSLKGFKDTNDPSKKIEELNSLNKTFLKFLQEYSRRQEMLAEEPSSGHAKKIDHILNEKFLPDLEDLSYQISYFSEKQDPESLKGVERVLEAFREAVYSCQAKLEKIQEENPKSISREVANRVAPFVKKANPLLQGYVEEIATNIFHLYKSRSSLESLSRHVLLLNFVESKGFKRI